MRQSVEMLHRYRYDPSFEFGRVQICYTHRGAPGNRACVSGDRVTHLANTYMEVETGKGTATIPYHRIEEILYDGRVEWKKGAM